jgi:hypothetical protein
MAKTTPQIHDRQLFCCPDLEPLCAVESPAWFAWLETATIFRYFSEQRWNWHGHYYAPFAPISLRKERRRQGSGMRNVAFMARCTSGMRPVGRLT